MPSVGATFTLLEGLLCSEVYFEVGVLNHHLIYAFKEMWGMSCWVMFSVVLLPSALCPSLFLSTIFTKFFAFYVCERQCNRLLEAVVKLRVAGKVSGWWSVLLLALASPVRGRYWNAAKGMWRREKLLKESSSEMHVFKTNCLCQGISP